MGGSVLTFDRHGLEYIASSYSKARLCAPLLFKGPQYNIVDHGEVDALFVQDDALYAQVTVSDHYQFMIKAGRYKYASPCFFAPSAPGNPMPSAYYLRYIGLWHEIPPALAPKYPERSNGLSFAEGYGIKATSATQAIPRLSPDNANTQIHMLATDYQNECPGMSFTEAATRAETTIHNQLKRK